MIIETGQYAIGIVQPDIDPLGFRVRVQFPDRDNMISWWLLVVVEKTHVDKGWWFPDPGDQVVCLMDKNFEEGVVLGATYNAQDAPPGATAPNSLRRTSQGIPLPTSPLAGSTFDEWFASAAAMCPALSTALPGTSAANILKGLSFSESSLNPNAVSEPSRSGSRCWGLMQISTDAHGGTPQYWLSNPNANIQMGEKDLCARLNAGKSLPDAIAGYKGFPSASYSATSQSQVNTALAYMQGYGMS